MSLTGGLIIREIYGATKEEALKQLTDCKQIIWCYPIIEGTVWELHAVAIPIK